MYPRQSIKTFFIQHHRSVCFQTSGRRYDAMSLYLVINGFSHVTWICEITQTVDVGVSSETPSYKWSQKFCLSIMQIHTIGLSFKFHHVHFDDEVRPNSCVHTLARTFCGHVVFPRSTAFNNLSNYKCLRIIAIKY